VSIDRSFAIAVGFEVVPSMLRTRKVPEKSHREDRYDEKTGVKLPMKAKVVDERERVVFVLNFGQGDAEFDEFEVACGALAEHLECDVELGGNCYFEATSQFAVFGPKLEDGGGSLRPYSDEDNVEGSPPVACDVSRDELDRIRKGLADQGVDAGPALITIVWRIS
jgi:hypothetical protein